MMENPFLPIVSFVKEILVAISFVYFVALVSYRLCLHPLSKYPGPKLAAVSCLYRAYHQTWRDGRLVEQLTHLHEVYGKFFLFFVFLLYYRSNSLL